MASTLSESLRSTAPPPIVSYPCPLVAACGSLFVTRLTTRILIQQVLYEIIHRIVNEFNGTDQARYAQAAADFRIPYWDWAMAPEDNGTVLPASVSSSAEVEVMSPTGPRRIQNPLYQYTFHPFNANELPDSIVANWPSTIRYPSDRTSSAVSRHDLIEQQLRNNRLSLRDRLYNLFATYNNYTEFSNTAWFPNNGGNFDSVESVHDQIHGLLGNNGHMTWVRKRQPISLI